MQTTVGGCLIKQFWFCTKMMISFWECRTVVAALHPIKKGFTNPSCKHMIHSETAKTGHFRLPTLHITWNSTTQWKHHFPLCCRLIYFILLAESISLPLSLTIVISGQSECYFRQCLLASKTEPQFLF